MHAHPFGTISPGVGRGKGIPFAMDSSIFRVIRDIRLDRPASWTMNAAGPIPLDIWDWPPIPLHSWDWLNASSGRQASAIIMASFERDIFPSCCGVTPSRPGDDSSSSRPGSPTLWTSRCLWRERGTVRRRASLRADVPLCRPTPRTRTWVRLRCICVVESMGLDELQTDTEKRRPTQGQVDYSYRK